GWSQTAILPRRAQTTHYTMCQYEISIRDGLIHCRLLPKTDRPGQAYRRRQILSVLMHRKAGSAFGAKRMNTAVSVIRFWYARQTETTRISRDTPAPVRLFRFLAV